MNKWALIVDYVVVEITDIDPEGRFHPDLLWLPCSSEVEAGWVATESEGVWSLAPYVPPPPTPEEILASQSAILQQLTQLANAQKVALTNRITTLQDAIDLEMATPEEVAELPVRQAQLLEWKRYAIYLGRVTGQDGWPPDVEWPVQPADGMDLTVSARGSESA